LEVLTVLQLSQLDVPGSVLCFPGAQCAHATKDAAALLAAAFVAVYPGRHMHAIAVAAPSGDVWLASQLAQVSEPAADWYLPAVHGVQPVPSTLVCPTIHAHANADSEAIGEVVAGPQLSQSAEPVSVLYFPAANVLHSVPSAPV